jgi:hypothetical protein
VSAKWRYNGKIVIRPESEMPRMNMALNKTKEQNVIILVTASDLSVT